MRNTRAHPTRSTTTRRLLLVREAAREAHDDAILGNGTMPVTSPYRPEPDRGASVGVMVVDDQASFRRAARVLIDATEGFEPVRDAGSGAEALQHADQLRPDLVLMDVYMPGMDGFEAARRLTDSHPECVVVLVSLEDLADLALEVASSGAATFVRKQNLKPSTLPALWTIHGRRPPGED